MKYATSSRNTICEDCKLAEYMIKKRSVKRTKSKNKNMFKLQNETPEADAPETPEEKPEEEKKEEEE